MKVAPGSLGGLRLWLESKVLEARMMRDVRLGRAEGSELTSDREKVAGTLAG